MNKKIKINLGYKDSRTNNMWSSFNNNNRSDCLTPMKREIQKNVLLFK